MKRNETARQSRKPRGLMELGDEMYASLRDTREFWEAFKKVKLDSFDNQDWGGERFVIVVARGDSADRLAEVYESV